jgi:hypothetical protein
MMVPVLLFPPPHPHRILLLLRMYLGLVVALAVIILKRVSTSTMYGTLLTLLVIKLLWPLLLELLSNVEQTATVAGSGCHQLCL